MSAVVATVSGTLTVAAVLVVASVARRPAVRPLPVAAASPAPRQPRLVRRASIVAAAAAVAVVVTSVAGPVGTLAVGGGAWLLVVRRRRTLAARRRRAVDAAMADAVELFVLCVLAGRSPVQAVSDLAARSPPVLRPAFAAVELQLHRGRSLADALGELPRLGGPIGHELAVAVASADRDGLPLGPALDRLAAEARAARRRAGEAEARRLPVRMTFPLVVCTLPSFVLLAIAPAVLGALSTLRANAP